MKYNIKDVCKRIKDILDRKDLLAKDMRSLFDSTECVDRFLVMQILDSLDDLSVIKTEKGRLAIRAALIFMGMWANRRKLNEVINDVDNVLFFVDKLVEFYEYDYTLALKCLADFCNLDRMYLGQKGYKGKLTYFSALLYYFEKNIKFMGKYIDQISDRDLYYISSSIHFALSYTWNEDEEEDGA